MLTSQVAELPDPELRKEKATSQHISVSMSPPCISTRLHGAPLACPGAQGEAGAPHAGPAAGGGGPQPGGLPEGPEQSHPPGEDERSEETPPLQQGQRTLLQSPEGARAFPLQRPVSYDFFIRPEMAEGLSKEAALEPRAALRACRSAIFLKTS